MVQPEHRRRRISHFAEDQRAGRLDHEHAQIVRDQRLAVLVHLGDFGRGADGDVRLALAVGHRPLVEVVERDHHVAGLEVGDLLQNVVDRRTLDQKVLAISPNLLGPRAAVFLLQRLQERQKRQFDAGEDVTAMDRLERPLPLEPQFSRDENEGGQGRQRRHGHEGHWFLPLPPPHLVSCF